MANVEESIKAALAATENVPDALRATAFGVVLGHLLLSASDATPSQRSARPTVSERLAGSMPEFVREKGPASHRDRVLSVAYFSYKSGEESGITLRDIEQAYRTLRMTRPGNPSDVVGSLVAQGRLIEAAEQKNGSRAWIITQSGEQYVDAGFQAT